MREGESLEREAQVDEAVHSFGFTPGYLHDSHHGVSVRSGEETGEPLFCFTCGGVVDRNRG